MGRTCGIQMHGRGFELPDPTSIEHQMCFCVYFRTIKLLSFCIAHYHWGTLTLMCSCSCIGSVQHQRLVGQEQGSNPGVCHRTHAGVQGTSCGSLLQGTRRRFDNFLITFNLFIYLFLKWVQWHRSKPGLETELFEFMIRKHTLPDTQSLAI